MGHHASARIRVDDDRRTDEVATLEFAAGQLAELELLGAGLVRFLDEFLNERLLHG